MDRWMRRWVLAIAANRWVSHAFNKYGMNLGVKRFVAAKTLEETILVVKRLNQEGLLVALDHLGESVADRDAAVEAAEAIADLLREIASYRLKANVSVKLTQLGLHIDEQFCLGNMIRIMDEAVKYHNFVCIDMEDSRVTEQTISLFKALQKQYGRASVGLCIQAYLYRSEKDVKELEQTGANLRLVKGAYNEPKEVAFPAKREVDSNHRRLVKRHLLSGCYTAIATHDTDMINEIIYFTKKYRIPRNRFEFQMLYGIAGGLQKQLVSEGFRVRVYTPYGKHWYPYFTRRIAERPANLLFVLKGLFRR